MARHVGPLEAPPPEHPGGNRGMGLALDYQPRCGALDRTCCLAIDLDIEENLREPLLFRQHCSTRTLAGQISHCLLCENGLLRTLFVTTASGVAFFDAAATVAHTAAISRMQPTNFFVWGAMVSVFSFVLLSVPQSGCR